MSLCLKRYNDICVTKYNQFQMIRIKEAKSWVERTAKSGATQRVSLQHCTNHYLSSDVISSINMPPFRQSAMDGYALNTHPSNVYTLVGEVKAGDEIQYQLQKGQAVRIFTGAPVPDTANAIVMQEKVTANEKLLTIHSEIQVNDNIRGVAEQIKAGDIALKKGTKLTPAGIGYLASLGIAEVDVFKRPSIAIVTTGNELVEADTPLSHGKIYESNSKMLHSALQSLDYKEISLFKVVDDYSKTVEVLKELLSGYDLVLITGGISVGDYDFVGRALQELSVKELFYKVNQKPGKPLYFGKKANTLVFALPGNPAAALSCFYLYVYTALEIMSGASHFSLLQTTATSVSEFIKKGDRAQFLKAFFENDKVTILEGQSSSMLQTFALANALVYVEEDKYRIAHGDEVTVLHLP